MDGELTVVVIDDMEGCRELYREWLKGGCDVRTAGDHREGIAQVITPSTL